MAENQDHLFVNVCHIELKTIRPTVSILTDLTPHQELLYAV
jgi:hypothetical protein